MDGVRDARLPPEKDTKRPQHTLVPVYGRMLLQVARDYAGIPDVRTLTMSEIRFFYDALRVELVERTKPRGK